MTRFLSILKISIFLIIAFFDPAIAAPKIPLSKDGYRDSAVFNGHQNMPVKLYGIAIKWNKDCLKGKTDQCLRLAQAFETGEGDLTAEIRIALGYYLTACDKGEGTGCWQAAMIIRNGSANFTNAELAQKTATHGCIDLKDQDACTVMALGLASNDTPLDHPEAEKIITTACHQGSDYGCQIKATSLFYDRKDPQSLQEAVKLFANACKSQQAWGCMGMAEAYEQGKGMKANPSEAFKAAEKGCLEAEGNRIPACAKYGQFLVKTKNSEDLNRGVKLLTKACLAQNAIACNDAGEVGKTIGRPSGIAAWEVALYFRDACDLNLAMGCLNLADIYVSGYDSIRIDHGSMVKLLDKACHLGNQAACNRVNDLGDKAKTLRARHAIIDPSLPALQQLALATKLADQGNREGLKTVKRLMREGVAEANWILGGWMYYGKPGIMPRIRKEEGIILFENAARQAHVGAAKWIGMAYWYGDGVPVDQKKGQGYMALAAASGDQMATAIYRSMLAEPIRQDNIRRQKEMEEEAERRKNDWGYQMSLATSKWIDGIRNNSYGSGTSPSAQMAKESWQRSQNALDKLNWNNAVNYSVGRTSACPMSNPYCR